MERQGEWKHMKPKQEWSDPAVLVKPGMKIRLKDIDPAPKPALAKDEAKAKVAENARAIDELQDRLYAAHSPSISTTRNGAVIPISTKSSSVARSPSSVRSSISFLSTV